MQNATDEPHWKHLCYGDMIVLQNPEESNAFIHSDGFLKTKLSLKTFDQANLFKSDFSSSIFQIYPQFANTFKSQVKTTENELKEANPVSGQQRKEKIESMQEKLTDEYSFNLETFNKHRNVAINYGKIVQLMHVASNKFLSVKFQEAEREKENYIIKLKKYSSETTFFKILPSFIYQKESEGKIFVDDIVYLACAQTYLNKIPYLHCTDTKPMIREKKTGPSLFQTNLNDIGFHSKIDPARHMLGSSHSPMTGEQNEEQLKAAKTSQKQITEINASLEKATHWRIHLFCEIIEDHLKDFLSYGDVVWLNNSDKKISLLGRRTKNNLVKRQPGEDFAKEMNPENTGLEVLFADTVITEDTMNKQGNTNGMWVIENQDYSRGGLISSTHFFRLKHFSSGKYLCVERREGGKKELTITEERSDKSLFLLKIVQEPIPKGVNIQEISKYVSKDAFIKIKNKGSGLWLGFEEVKSDLSEMNYKPSLNHQLKDEDVFKIARANTNELLETSFLKSCKNRLRKYIEFLKRLQKKTVTGQEINALISKEENVTKCLKDLELFVTNQLFNTSPSEKFGSYNRRRQKILREQYYIEMLIQLLLTSMSKSELERYFALKELTKELKEEKKGTSKKKAGLKNIVSKIKDWKSVDQQKAQEDRLFLQLNSVKLKIVKLTFRLFIYICKDFEENERFMFDMIPDFNYYFEYISPSIDFLISLVRNNEFIMKKISESLGSLSLSAIEKLSAILELEITNQEEPSRESNIAVIANTLKLTAKKNEMIKQFIDLLAEENNEEDFKIMKSNLLLLFAAIAKKTYKKERNLRLLRFFRTICSHQRRGITSNQEILSKIFKNDSYHRAILMHLIVDNDVMKIENTDGKILFFEEIFLMELKIKRGDRQLFTNPEDNPDDDCELSNIMNKSKVDATFISLDRGTTNFTSGAIPTMKEEEKLEEGKNEALVNQMDKMISYLNEQLIFFSELCLGRNYIWKRTLENVFPIQFVFAQIYNKKIFKETRSAFTRLALNLYIDQQPFSPAIYPQLCRIFSPNKDQTVLGEEPEQLIGQLEGMTLEKKVFEGLLRESLEYVRSKSSKVHNQLTAYERKIPKKEKERDRERNPDQLTLSPSKSPNSKFENSPGDKESIKEFRFKNYLNNMLLFDILSIISKLLSFNLFQMIQQEEHYITLFPNLISLLEFDFSNPLISLAVVNKREKLFRELVEDEKKKQNLMATGLSGIKNLFSDVVDNVTGLTKEMAGTILGQTGVSKSKAKKTNPFLDRYNENLLYSHPLMRSCLSQRNRLTHLGGEEETKMIKVEKDLKILIIEVMKQFLGMRHDFILTNFIEWYQEIGRRNPNPTEEKLKSEISENFLTVIPEILKVGILAVDFKYQIKEDGNVLNNIGGNLMNIVGNIGNLIAQEEEDQSRYLQKKFKVYTKEKEVKDLDGLLTGPLDEKISISKTLYPSLIMMFYSTQDPALESKFLEIIMLCFHQRLKFSESLKTLELLFDKSDVENYVNLQKTVREMRSICEKSELWISEWLNTGKVQPELNELKKIISFMIATFRSQSIESPPEGRKLEDQILESDDEQFLLINPVRQKIACFLEIHTIMIDFLKDTIHLMDKILKDRRIEIEQKRQFLSLYKRIFLFLRFFVKNNSNNQEILYEYLDGFLIHMEMDLGQADLICEIFKNNLSLCEGIKPEILNCFIEYIMNFGRREKFLNLFEIVQSANGQPIFESQVKVINAILGIPQDEKNEDSPLLHVLYMKYEGVLKEQTLSFDFEIKSLDYYLTKNKNNHLLTLQFDQQGYKERPWDQPYLYHAKMLKVLALTNKGMQGSTLSNARLRKQFELSLIFRTLVSEDTLTSSPKKRGSHSTKDLLIGMKKAGSGEEEQVEQTKKTDAFLLGKRPSQKIKNKKLDLSHLKPALINYLNGVYLPIKKGKDDFQRISDNVQFFLTRELNRVREASAEEIREDPYREYFFVGVMKFLQDYVTSVVVQAINENLESKDNEILFEMAETLESRLPDLENSLRSDQVEDLKKFLLHYFQMTDELNDKLAKCYEEDEKRNQKNVSQSNMSINTEIFEEGLDNNFCWKAFISLCMRSDILKKEIEREMKALCESFIKIHLMFDDDDKKKYNFNVTMKDILQKLLNFMENALDRKEEKARKEGKETIMFTIEIIIKMIQIFPKKEEIQSTLNQINAPSMILSVITDMKSNEISDDIFDGLLSFLIAMLEGGNQTIQKSIYSYFIAIQSSEFVFEKFYRIINDQIEAMKAKKHDNTQSEAPKRRKTTSAENEKLKKGILEKVLRIMQMLTEGHYKEMQLYLQEQTNSRNSYDLVSSVIELLYIYHTDLGINNYHNILRCFETLTELVQTSAPKFRPQVLEKSMKSRKTVAGKKKKPPKLATETAKLKRNNKSSSPDALKRWMLERIKYKCMILIYSLLEMKKGDDFVKRIIRSLPLEILKRNLSEIYRRYKKKYNLTANNLQLKKDSLKKFEDDPEDKHNKNSESEYELIIETGFYTFFLIKEYLEVIQDPELQFEDQVKTDQKENLLKGSIIGQLGSLGLSIMNAGLDTVSLGLKAVNKNIIKQFIINDEGDDGEKEKLKKEMRAIELKGIMKEALKFFNLNSGHIEVLREKGLEKVYFMMPTYCHYLPEETKEEFSEKVDRSSLESKLEEFVKESHEFIRIARHEEKLAFFFNQNKILAIFANYVRLWKEIAFFMNIVLNIFIIVSFSDFSYTQLSQGYLANNITLSNGTVVENRLNLTRDMIWEKRMYQPQLMQSKEYSYEETKSIMQKCGIVMIVCACFVVLFFMCKKAPLYIQQSWGDDEPKDQSDDDDPTKKKLPFSIRLFMVVRRIATCIIKFFLNIDVIYYTAYAALAILGATLHEFFFCFHLTELFLRFPTLKNVIRSVYEPREALILTFILWLILEYIFAIWAFNFLRDQYSSTDDLNDSFCTELLICWLYTFDYTFKSNGGIGSQLDGLREDYFANNPSKPKFTLTRFVFDNLFTIVIVIIMVTIVAGIIIDTFRMLRDNENDKLKDMEGICFMCGLKKEIFERQVDLKKGFSMHIMKEHFQWNYVYFIAFLKDKDPGEYTGIESYIHQKIVNSDLTWFPKGRALSLTNMEEEGDEQTKRDFINNTVKDIDDFKKGTLELKEELIRILKETRSGSPNKFNQ